MDTLKRVREKQIRVRRCAGEIWQGWQTKAERTKALVLTTDLGVRLSTQTVYLHHKKVAAAAGALDARLHDLRHTFAVLSLQNGDEVQGNLGHATAVFTLATYGHISERMKKESSDRMQKYLDELAQA